MAKKKATTKAEEIKVEEVVEKEKEEEVLPVITLDNQPVSPIIVENDEEEIPNNFVDVKPVINTKAKHNIYNGRVYKVLNNGRGMFADNGETFDLSIIK